MIVWYFCQRLLVTFFLILGVLTALLSVVNVVGKNIFSSPELVIALFMGALPFMAVFIYSFALVCASFLVFYAVHQRGEFIVIHLFSRLRRQLFISSLLHTFVVTIIFIPLVFWIAPRSYDWGKQFLYVLLEQKLSVLTPGLLHFPAPGIATYFEESEQQGAVTVFHNFFMIQEKRAAPEPTLSTALWSKEAAMSDKKISLQTGMLVLFDTKKKVPFSVVAAFDDGVLDLAQLFETSKKIHAVPIKYQTIVDLWPQEERAAVVERYRRYLQVFWVLLTPPCFHIFCLSWQRLRRIHNLFYVAGGWFFLLYVQLLLVPLFVQWSGIATLPLLFFPVFGLLCLVYKKFLKFEKG